MDKSKLTSVKKSTFPQKNGYPVEFAEYELCSNKDTMGIVLFINMKNTCTQKIDFVRIKIDYYDSDGSLLGTKIAEFDKIGVSPDGFFGFDKAINVSSLMTDSVSVTLQKAVFADKSIWQCGDDLQNTAEIPYGEINAALVHTKNVNPWDKNTAETKRTKKRHILKSAVTAAILCAAAAAVVFAAVNNITQKNNMLDSAAKAYADGDYLTARGILDELLDKRLSAKARQNAVMYRAFTAIHTENYITAIHYLSQIKDSEDAALYLRRLNTAVSGMAAAGEKHSIALTKDGHVLSAGSNEYGQCNTAQWNDVIAVAAGGSHSVGLKYDGTVYATGDNESGQCDIGDWRNISAIAAGGKHSVGVMNNGRVVAAGDNESGQCDVKSWSGIIAVSAGEKHTVGLRQDGTVYAVGDNSLGACDVGEWRNIVSVTAGNGFTVGADSSGKVYVTGDNSCGQYDAQSHDNTAFVTAGSSCIITLNDGRADGFGDNEWYQLNVSAWKQIVSAASGLRHSIGICSDGTAYAAGDDKSGQCDVSEWNGLGLPKKALEKAALLNDGNIFKTDK